MHPPEISGHASHKRAKNYLYIWVPQRHRHPIYKHRMGVTRKGVCLHEASYILLWQVMYSQNDHKHVEMIEMKTFFLALFRIKWMLLHLQQYDRDIKHKLCKEIFLADILLEITTLEEQTWITLDFQVEYIALSKACLAQLRRESAWYFVLSLVYHLTHHGWSATLWHLPRVVQCYCDIHKISIK